MEKNIAVIWGDCSSPEIVKQTLRVLDKVAEKYGHTFHYTAAAMGGEAIDKYGDPLPQQDRKSTRLNSSHPSSSRMPSSA